MKLIYWDQKNCGYEIVERKGKGHPDTIADELAEELSRVYANYTKERYGAVLHHNFDKVGLMGGMTKLGYGQYEIKNPIRVLINGRASRCFHSEKIDVRDMLENTAKEFLKKRLYGIDADRDLRIIYEVASGSSPGAVGENSGYRNRWFAPEGLSDLSELQFLHCNDTSLGAAFYHRRVVENCVYCIEQLLNSPDFHAKHPWLGTDIKIMGCRNGMKLKFTMAVPQLASFVKSKEEYLENKEFLYHFIMDKLHELEPSYYISLYLNTRDKEDACNTDFYLTATGSSIEMGDEGFVGRGNRMGGLITPFRPYTMEGICGKNPVYHTGKMYCAAAWEISRRIYETQHVDCSVLLVGQSGQRLERPWNIVLTGDAQTVDMEYMKALSAEVLGDFSKITENLLRGNYPLC